MERKLSAAEELLEIMLNFLVVVCVEIGLDALGGSRTPLFVAAIPLTIPLAFYAARKWAQSLLLFLAVHAAAVLALFWLAGEITGSLLWQLGYALIGIFYAVHSVRIRVTNQGDREGAVPPAVAGGVAVVAFLLCSIQNSDIGCSRILWICLLWLPGLLIRSYLGNYSRYVEMNRKTAGTMPEDRIFAGGAGLVGLYSAVSLLVLAAGSKTALIPWLSEVVRSFLRVVIRLLGYALELLTRLMKPESAGGGSDQGMEQLMEDLEETVTPAWMRVLEQILIIVVLLVVFAAVLFGIFLLVRFLIQGFYGREKKEKRIEEKGYVEEEKRLDRKERRKKERLPAIGGTPAQRVRRIFKRTVAQSLRREEEGAAAGKTARELAAFCAAGGTSAGKGPESSVSAAFRMPGNDANAAAQRHGSGAAAADEGPKNETAAAFQKPGSAEWDALAALYERARYADAEITAEEAKHAGKLSREILHTIK